MKRTDPINQKAFELLHGFGVEIGALHNPFDLDATVLRLDFKSREDLAEQYKNDERAAHIVPVHITTPGDKLSFICSGVFDFVCNCHVLEHLCNPGKAIEEWLRVIKPGGRIYMVVPDKRFSFDRRREITTTAHLLEDFTENTQEVQREHYADYLVTTNGEDGHKNDTSEESIERFYSTQQSIHVHTFTSDSLDDFLTLLQEHLPFRIIHRDSQGLHIHFALEKTE